MNNNEELISNIDKIHTTPMGLERIKRNTGINTEDIINWCKLKIKDSQSIINRKGKNWYITNENIIITVNAYSYTIITAHKIK